MLALHRRRLSLALSLLLAIAGHAFADTSDTTRNSGPSAHENARPNILIILADDLGYSDLGCYGSEIETPHLDTLAQHGLRFTQFYNTGRCWPTRAALLTGYYAQQVRRDTVPEVPSGGQGQRPSWAVLLPERLKQFGYRCYHAGKWHLDGMPLATGFDRSYYLQDQGRYFNPQVHYEDDVKLPAVRPDGDYYATSAIADHFIAYLKEHAQRAADQPFFGYLAFTAPHFPLHVSPAERDPHLARYQGGWDRVREARWQRIEHLQLVNSPPSQVEREIGPPFDFPHALRTLGPAEVNRPLAWMDLTPAQRQFQATKMALHAAMIHRMDLEVGRVCEQLRRMQAWENTLVMFLSDNGASAEIMVRDDGHDPRAEPGTAASYLCLGPGWSTTSNTPFRRHKTWVHEGGIATPLIVHWPARLSDHGQLRRQPAHVIDLVPTILEIAVSTDTTWNHGDRLAPTWPGVSLVSVLVDDAPLTQRELWWLHEGNRAMRQDDWKLVAARDEPWQLFNLAQDRCETNDLSEQYPQKATQLEALWTRRYEEYCRTAQDALPVRQPVE